MTDPFPGVAVALHAQNEELRARLHDARADLTSEREHTARCMATIARLEHERDEARALVLEVFTQACRVSPTGMPRACDHYHISAYKDAQDKLIEWGAIKREECVRP